MELVHGGDWAGYRARFGHDALDFSANVSPLGLPQGVADAIVAALPTADRYPDPLCRELRTALSRAEQLPEPWILCGNGAADLIYRLVWALKPRRALLPAPTFAEYAAALESVGCEVKRKTLHEADDFAVTEAFVQAVNQSIDLVFLCQPNNQRRVGAQGIPQPHPGHGVQFGERFQNNKVGRGLQKRFGRQGIPLLQKVQKALIHHQHGPAVRTAAHQALHQLRRGNLPGGVVGLAQKHQVNALVHCLQAFTKLYAMAGVRLGYALCANTALLAKMQAAGQPWGVSSLAQAAGAAALRETAYADAVRALIADQRPRLAAGLRALGLQVIEGSANYLLFRAPKTLGAVLQQRGVCLRSCGNYPGLSAGWYRTAVRTAPENEQLLQTMREVLK